MPAATTATHRHILCTGGAGYIGSHTVLQLLSKGHKVTILDSLVNASMECVVRMREIAKVEIPFILCDLTDKEAVEKIFRENQFDAVIHFAGLKAVGESVDKPLMYYRNNLQGSFNLLDCMTKYGPKCIVFSSSATVYAPKEEPVTEEDALKPSNPYGQTKLFIEQLLRDIYTSDNTWKISILRYFNPAGAHPSGRIGESPEMPNNLLPYIQQVAVGRRPHVNVFGNDWPTRDGTGVRDYLHIEDLAEGHICALEKLFTSDSCCLTHNLGTGNGTSVLEMVKYFQKASGVQIKTEFTPRRPGDLATVVADPRKANEDLKWKAMKTVEEGCASAWKWQSNNPHGYDDDKDAKKEKK